MTKVSVIIPLYNSARFLPSLFSNIAQQTIAADCEFIFIDDHGGDDSLALARSLAASFPLRCLFGATVANGGPGAARNAGLKMAGGEYVAFLDSDDALLPLFCERLYDAAAACDADLAYCHILAVKEGKSVLSSKTAGSSDPEGWKGRGTVWSNPSVAGGDFSGEKRLYFLKKYKSYFTSFIYRRSLLVREGIVFPPTRSAEDSCFLTCSLLCASRIAFVDEALYIYQLRNDSLSSGRLDDRHMQRMESFDALLEFARKKGLYEADREILDYLYIKKAAVGAARNNPLARREIKEHCLAAVPGFRSSRYWRSDLRLRLAARLLLGL